jgi:hypothetical protein
MYNNHGMELYLYFVSSSGLCGFIHSGRELRVESGKQSWGTPRFFCLEAFSTTLSYKFLDWIKILPNKKK